MKPFSPSNQLVLFFKVIEVLIILILIFSYSMRIIFKQFYHEKIVYQEKMEFDEGNWWFWTINLVSLIFLLICMLIHCKTGIYHKGFYSECRHKIMQRYYNENFKYDLITLSVILFYLIVVYPGRKDLE